MASKQLGRNQKLYKALVVQTWDIQDDIRNTGALGHLRVYVLYYSVKINQAEWGAPCSRVMTHRH